MTPLSWILRRVEAARGRLFPWVPVLLAVGIGGYFQLLQEPTQMVLWGLGLMVLACLGLARWAIWRGGAQMAGGAPPILYALALLCGGVLLASARTHSVAGPVLGFRFYGAVEGRIVMIDRSQSDAVRLTLDQVRLSGVRPHKTPTRVRVSLHGTQGFMVPEPGLRVVMTAHLSAPQGPVEPGGFDFRRMAWFREIGAVGYTRVPVLAIAPVPRGEVGLAVHRLRMGISSWVQGQMRGEAGAFAAAVMTGDRSGMGQGTLAALRGSNLAHLLAISGLHMGLLTGFIFSFSRYAMALMGGLALRFSTKKIAAVLALGAGAFYYAMSGGNVATERAFIMVAVMFGAVLIDRRALTLRAVAMAAIIVLCLRPETLTEPGFQMSFSATTALVAVFGWLREWRGWRAPRWARPVLAVVVSSAVAGAATGPFGAAHFNQISHFGLIANLISVPVMGAIVMPGAVLAGVLAPFGLSGVALAVMRPAIEWILAVAHRVSTLDGAVGHVPTPPGSVLPLIAVGGLLVVLLQGRVRGAGLPVLMAGFLIWSQVVRPDLLVSQSGGLIGVMTAQGRALNKPRGEGFSATSWLENDGEGARQPAAAGRPGFHGQKGALWFELAGLKVFHLSGRGAGARVGAACEKGDMVILSATLKGAAPPGCQVIDRGHLETTGPLALFHEDGGLRIVQTARATGLRPWVQPAR